MGLQVLFVMFWRSTSVAILWLCTHFCILSGAVSCSIYICCCLNFCYCSFSSLFWFIYMFVAESKFSALLTNGRHFCVTCLTKYWTFSLVILAINPWSRSKTHLLIRALRTIITPAKKDGLWGLLYISGILCVIIIADVYFWKIIFKNRRHTLVYNSAHVWHTQLSGIRTCALPFLFFNFFPKLGFNENNFSSTGSMSGLGWA